MVWEGVYLDWVARVLRFDANLLSSIAHMYYQLDRLDQEIVDATAEEEGTNPRVEPREAFRRIFEAVLQRYLKGYGAECKRVEFVERYGEVKRLKLKLTGDVKIAKRILGEGLFEFEEVEK